MTNPIAFAREIELGHMQERLRSTPWWKRGWVIWTIGASAWLGLLYWVWTTPHLQ